MLCLRQRNSSSPAGTPHPIRPVSHSTSQRAPTRGAHHRTIPPLCLSDISKALKLRGVLILTSRDSGASFDPASSVSTRLFSKTRWELFQPGSEDVGGYPSSQKFSTIVHNRSSILSSSIVCKITVYLCIIHSEPPSSYSPPPGTQGTPNLYICYGFRYR